MKLSEIVALGSVKYTHVYNQTMTNADTAKHILECPKSLKTLSEEHEATVERYSAGQLVILIDGKPAYSNDAGTRNYYGCKDLNSKQWDQNPWLFIEQSGLI